MLLEASEIFLSQKQQILVSLHPCCQHLAVILLPRVTGRKVHSVQLEMCLVEVCSDLLSVPF